MRVPVLALVFKVFGGAALLGAMATSCGGDDSTPDWVGTACGGFAGAGSKCDLSVAYCDYEGSNPCQVPALDGSGICRLRPESCPKDCPGVCGCDGKFYCNACEAHRAGVDDGTDTSCMP